MNTLLRSNPLVRATHVPLLLFVTPVAASENMPDMASGLAQMVMGLAVVIALLLASLWLIKRLSAPRGAASGLRVLGGVAVGSRERVVLVEVGKKVLVLGVTSANVNTLHTMDAAELPQQPSPDTIAAAGSAFSARLRNSIEARKKGE